ncbi:uncharacterized protein PRCAT00005155001 [Priceomyces carsonii]|uniref:uncharacterized protein n=1 Tax=Priceomyces carsonii TaxID=28549 RepID=UPI002ED7F09B|nr:unnamed protein product [Priceomyces carsonii]
MSNGAVKAITILFVGGLSWYAGLKFWQPLVIDQLRKDDNLRNDIYIRDTSDQPASWSDLKEKVRETLHPNVQDPKETQVKTDLVKETSEK